MTNQERHARYYHRHKEAKNAKDKERRNDRIEKGLCIRCGSKAWFKRLRNGKLVVLTRCKKHAADNNATTKNCQKKKAINKMSENPLDEAAQIIAKHHRRETGKWYKDADTKKQQCTEEEADKFKRTISKLRFQAQCQNEERFVLSVLANNNDIDKLNEEEKTNFYRIAPLVSRRKHPELWGRIGKHIHDGSLFTFQAPSHYFVCGCTDDQLRESHIGGRATEKDIEALRQIHNDGLAAFTSEKAICPNAQDRTVFQMKHTIGNWNCKACMTQGREIVSEETASSALAAPKALEWCPRYFPLLRHLPFVEYLKVVKENKVCYAGLLHSEMLFTNEQQEGITKYYAVITKRCDTCHYEDVIKKEYHQPDEVAADQILQVMK